MLKKAGIVPAMVHAFLLMEKAYLCKTPLQVNITLGNTLFNPVYTNENLFGVSFYLMAY